MVYRSRLIIPCKKHFKRTDRRVIGFRGLIQLKISFIILSDKPKIYAFFAFLNDGNAQERKENHVLVNCSNLALNVLILIRGFALMRTKSACVKLGLRCRMV